MEFIDIVKYYSKPIVMEEICKYSVNRWIAIHTASKGGSQFIRYSDRERKPLKISKPEDIRYLLFKYRGLNPRTFYASINIYRKLGSYLDVDNPENIILTTPIWDIDGSIEGFSGIVKAAQVIIDILERFGIYKSVYIKWSGRGIHIHINEKAISTNILSKHHPLDIAYSIVDYVLDMASCKIRDIIKNTPVGSRTLKVENEMDIKRVFTVPLSLHKELDYCNICISPDDLEEFDLEWADPKDFNHYRGWDRYVEAEADELAERAIKAVGGYFERVGGVRRVIEEYREVVKRRQRAEALIKKVGRFQVMALLQAARYYVLIGDIDKAKSFGLNRAIFYAWAKYHGKNRGFKYISAKTGQKDREMFKLGDEATFVSKNGWFMIGDKEQFPSDYDKEIANKINFLIPYHKAWEKAVKYVKQFDKNILLSQRAFYRKVYEPIRDKFFSETSS